MRFYADLHIHSKYSRACSRDCDLEHLTWWARRKGIALVGTGDFTHPAWYAHLTETLEPAEPGLYRLKPDLDRDINRTLPGSCAGTEVRFMLSVEISTIYKRGDKTRKVHHLIYMPDLEAAARFNQRLGKIGNLGSDGRPILGLDSRDLLEITLEASPDAYLVPAHVWTPWFAVLGSKSGFDAIEDCYLDLAQHIFAVETGLSSDPEMNWQVSGLDKYRLVSNSDAHSPPMLGREATVFDTDLDYFALRRALETGEGFAGTAEFFPEEGKYHLDGHRKCDVRFDPAQTRAHQGRCPECKKPLTVGVLSRINDLADRPLGFRPEGAAGFRNLVPLPEIMSEIVGVGPKSKKVQTELNALTTALGPELAILDEVPLHLIAEQHELLGEAIGRLRQGKVFRDSGFDGEYGVIRMFEPGELRRRTEANTFALFEDSLFAPEPTAPARRADPEPDLFAEPEPEPETTEPADLAPEAATESDPVAVPSLLDGLDPDQRAAAERLGGPLLIIAGPGTGKTRTLTHRLAHLVTAHDVPPEQCLAITFTRRAAEEMRERLAALAPGHAGRLTICTFHALGVRFLRELHERLGLSANFTIAGTEHQLAILTEITGAEKTARELLDGKTEWDADLRDRYTKTLRARDLVDFDDLITQPVALLEADPELAESYRDRYRWISVDEYQDVDELQYRLLRLLAGERANLTAIGDPDQAIYRFRGADVGFFLRFRQDFPGAATVQLTRNYRSGKHIITGARQAIEPTTLVPGRELLACGSHAEHALIGLHTAADETTEAAFLARTIDQLLGGSSFHSLDSGRVQGDGDGGLSFSDFAVLYRTDSQARAVVEALTRAGVPFQKRSHDRLLHRPGVAEILRELSFVGPEQATDVPARVRAAAEAALSRIPAAELDERAVDIHTALDLLAPLSRAHEHDLDAFRTELSLGAEVDSMDPRADRVSLLTLHAAKGLEFPVVFLIGCEDGLLPLRWQGATDLDAEHVNEERRLFFVGMTRAQDRLYLSHAAQRHRHGADRNLPVSPFLAVLGPDLLERHGEAVPRKRKPRQISLF
ncbi:MULTISPECIES: UvrD-helicase domain-containing protein [unclassified Crossiella]|uniref:UvrD-helicase domain-containing protein n=1 Tax=unclassified Crossiella TaxID=2620835 RepID=UPI002000363F|nr:MULTISPECIES: UvrD-helicase domain-containing protein [unclassified Crossiella]MCK2238752.1 UvrD-helicase domain-containing protein [Crossiella sp. S99.2]MCK2251678.1 UvrD-helicase domain-containing protein [Crossiella sp. S99.1]